VLEVKKSVLYGDTVEEQEKLLHLDLDTLITHLLYDMKEMINPRDLALFLLPRMVLQKHHTVGQKLLWVKTENVSIQSWQKEGGISLGEGARLRLAHQIERLEGRRPKVHLRHKLV
jgi:hypothetical protein